MVPCPIPSEQLSLRLDRRLPADEAAALEAHLAGCPHCRHLAARLEAVDRLLRGAPMAMPQRDLTAAILRAVAPQREQRLLGLTLALAALLAASPSLLLVAGIVTVALGVGRSDILYQGIALVVESINQFYALVAAVRIILAFFDPWVIAGLSAVLGIALLGLTLLWGQRSMRPALYAIPHPFSSV